MRVAVIGGGVAGLASARELSQRGVKAVVFEAGGEVGGRVSTVRSGGYIADHGAQQITPRGMAIGAAILTDLDSSDLVRVGSPTFLLQGARAVSGSPEKNATPRYTYRSGNVQLAKLLSEGLEVRLNTRVDSIDGMAGSLVVCGETFDVVILTGAMPDIREILKARSDRRADLPISYRACISVCLGFASPAPVVPYYGLLSMDRMAPVVWIGIESAKCEGRAPEGHSLFVAQFGPNYSSNHFDASDQRLTDMAIFSLQKVFGSDYAAPDWSYVHRWQHSQPERVALFDNINPEGTRILIAGDGTLAGRIENAYESGILAAKRISKMLS